MKTPRRIVIASLAAAFAPFAFAQAPATAPAPAAAPAPAGASCKSDAPKIKLTTSMGPIVLQLDRQKAPLSVENFVKYVESKHYDGTIFHRVMDGFMIQGGGFTKDMQQKPTQAPIKLEAGNGLRNATYSVAMARTNVPDSATSQFFINVADNEMLNAAPGKPGYAVFGRVIEGRETVDKIRKVATGNAAGGHQNVPLEAVTLTKAECA